MPYYYYYYYYCYYYYCCYYSGRLLHRLVLEQTILVSKMLTCCAVVRLITQVRQVRGVLPIVLLKVNLNNMTCRDFRITTTCDTRLGLVDIERRSSRYKTTTLVLTRALPIV